MKRLVLFLMIMLALRLISSGQVATTYVFSQTQGTFEPITNGTVLWSGSFNNNEAIEVAIPGFLYDGTVYTKIYVSENGFITFGASSASSNVAPISNSANYAGAISAFGANLHQALSGTPEVSYKQIGSEFIIQWKDVRRFFQVEIISFQIRLNMTDNSIAIIYGGDITPGNVGTFPQVGLRGPNNTYGVNVNNRTIAINGGNWINSLPGTANNSTMYFRINSPATVPTQGLTFSWIPGIYIPCYTPTNISVGSITTNSADFNWNPPSPQPPEGYEWEVRTAGSPGSGVTGLTTSGTIAAGITQVTVNGLSVASEYVFYIRSHCGVDNYSVWSSGTTFVTACLPLSVLPYAEGFETVSFPPPCMTNVQLTGSGLWNAVVNGTNPSTPPYAGSKMASYNCFNYSAGASAALVLPQMQLEPGNYKLSFQMYRDNGYASNTDRVEIYVNSSPQSGGGTLLGTVNRSINLNPQVPENGWYLYEFEHTVGNRESIYFILVGISDYGNDIFIDDLNVNEVSNATLSWNNLHWPPDANIGLNEQLTVYAQCWEENVTNIPGPGEGIEVWIGYSDENTNPENWTNWISAVFNLDVGNNDEFMADLGLPQGLAQGVYYYASRFRYLDGSYTYGGYNVGGGGTWDGADNVSGVLTVTPCGAFALPFNEGFESVAPPAMPICWDKDIQSSSIYPYIESLTSNSPNSGQNHVVLYNSVDVSAFIALVSPAVDGPLSDVRSLFYAKGTNGQLLEVGTYAEDDFNLIETIVLSTTYQLYNVSFANYDGSHNRIAFKHGLGGTFRPIYLDDILIEQLPPPCNAPLAQPSGLVLTSTSNSITGTFSNSDATAYLVIQHTNPNLGNVPINTVKYNTGDQLGNGTVVYSGSETSFTVDNLNPFTQYYYTVFAYNSAISCNGPTYRTASPLTGSTATLPAAPDTFTALPLGPSQIGFTATANSLGHNIMIAWSTESTTAFGTPIAMYPIGSTIPGGGVVHYVGPANEVYNHNNLSENTTYYYRAWTIVPGPIYSSTSLLSTAKTPCSPSNEFPVIESFEDNVFPPFCWNNSTQSGTAVLWDAVSTGSSPAVSPKHGSKMARFNSFSYSSGNSAILAVKNLNFNDDQYWIKFWMYRDNGYPTNADRVLVHFNTSPNLTGSTLLGTINRSNTLAPAAPIGWNQYVFNLPEGVSGSGYFILQAISAFGNNIFVDDIKIEPIPTSPIFVVTPQQADFGSQSILMPSVPQVFTFYNDGIGTLSVNSIAIGGPDANQFILNQVHPLPILLGPDQAATVSVTFAPSAVGPKTAQLVITDDLNNRAVHSLPLTGIGVDPTITSFPYVESFDEPTFAPTGWTNTRTAGTGTPGIWERTTAGASPTAAPKSGAAMAQFRSFDFSAGTKAELITPPINFPEGNFRVSFWMYRDAGYPNNTDLVNVYFNTTNSLEDAMLLGTVNRSMTLEPVVLTQGWHAYSYFLPEEATGNGRYIILEAISAYGNNIFIDDFSIGSPMVVTHTATNLSCFESNDGSIALNIEGGIPPLTIIWKKDDVLLESTNPVLEQLSAAVYEYTVREATGNAVTEIVTLTQPAAIPVATATNTTFVYDGTVKTINAVAPAGTTLVWYAQAVGGVAVAAPAKSDAGVYNYWVAAKSNTSDCQSPRVGVVLTINKKALTVKADDKSKCQNTDLPLLTITYTGFVANEGVAQLTELPIVTTTALPNSPIGTYPITVSGGISNNYSFVYQSGTLTVVRTPMVFAGGPGFVCVSEVFPIVAATATNFTTLVWTTSGNGTFSNAGILNPVYTPGSMDIANGSVVLTLTADPGSYCSGIDQMVLSIQNDLPVSVTITQDDTEICIGELVTFNAVPVNGGLSPVFQWKVNGQNAGSNSSIFTYLPSNGDVVTVIVTTSISCALNTTATSNAITVNVTSDLIAGVMVSTTSNAVCDFTPTNFFATPVNGGTNPTYQWKVNGENAGTNAPQFTYIPLNGDEVSVVMTSSHSCAVVPVAISNVITMSVAPPFLELAANPTKGGTVSGGGNYPDGTEVTITATAAAGWEFLNWRNADGSILSTEAVVTFTINKCYEKLTATFSSTAKIVGQLKYFNENESVIPSPNNRGVFYVQIFENGQALSQRQVVAHNLELGLDSYYEFTGVESGKDYSIRIWEEATNNTLGNTWSFNNWGGATSADAFIISWMANMDPQLTAFPWIWPAGATALTPYSEKVADVNNNQMIANSDALMVLYRLLDLPEFSPFPGGAHNFSLATTKIEDHQHKAHPVAPEKLFTQHGGYLAGASAPSVYQEVLLTNLSDGTNIYNIYFLATGDLNTSYTPGGSSKQLAMLEYNGVINTIKGDEIMIPVRISQASDLGAITLGFSYNNDAIEVLDVIGYDLHNIDHENGTVKIAWYDHQSKSFASDQHLVILKARLKGELSTGTRYLELLPFTELADANAMQLQNVTLRTDYIETAAGIKSNPELLSINHSIFPNPFNDYTNIQYTLPNAGKVRIDVYNLFGQLVISLVDEMQKAGTHKLMINNYELNGAGSYFYQINVESDRQRFTERGTIVLTK
jgi:hypothetical protein